MEVEFLQQIHAEKQNNENVRFSLKTSAELMNSIDLLNKTTRKSLRIRFFQRE